jgi:hypothetical protein
MSFVPFFMTPFRTLQPEGKPGTGRAAAAYFEGENAPKSPQFWAFWGDFLRGKPKTPKIFLELPPKNGFSEGAIFSRV